MIRENMKSKLLEEIKAERKALNRERVIKRFIRIFNIDLNKLDELSEFKRKAIESIDGLLTGDEAEAKIQAHIKSLDTKRKEFLLDFQKRFPEKFCGKKVMDTLSFILQRLYGENLKYVFTEKGQKSGFYFCFYEADTITLYVPWGVFIRKRDYTINTNRIQRELAKIALEKLYISLI